MIIKATNVENGSIKFFDNIGQTIRTLELPDWTRAPISNCLNNHSGFKSVKGWKFEYFDICQLLNDEKKYKIFSKML